MMVSGVKCIPKAMKKETLYYHVNVFWRENANCESDGDRDQRDMTFGQFSVK